MCDAQLLTLPSGRVIACRRTGSGRPLVFVHGWSMSGRVWKYQAEGLSDRYSVIAPDLRGHGDSPAAESYSVEVMADDLRELFELLDLREAVLVGWSLGGEVALAAAPLLEGRLSGLVLVGTTPRFTASADFPHGLPEQEVRGMALRLRRAYLKTMEDFFRGMFAPGEVDDEGFRRIAGDIVRNAKLPEPGVALAVLETLASADLRDLVGKIGLPVLLLHGEGDSICLPGASAWMAERFFHGGLVTLPGVGHAPFLSRPDLFNKLVAEFAEGF